MLHIPCSIGACSSNGTYKSLVPLLYSSFVFSNVFVFHTRIEHIFFETYEAFEEGRGGTEDPSQFYYEHILKIFDDKVIPLARKLAGCEAFGVSNDECLEYALENRKKWEEKGHDVVYNTLCRYLRRK